MAESEAMKLLFCETFSHENAKDPNLDLIQFTWPVIVQEIRVIPWGARVHPDLHKVPTVGQTQPGGFSLEFFANNLNNHGAAVFERIGSFHYQDSGEIQLVPKTKLPTDGLVVRGRYASVTLAVFGTMQNRRSESPPPPPPPPPKQQSHSKRTDDKVREKKVTDEAIQLEEEIPRMTEEEQKIIAFGKDAKRGPKTPPHGQELVEEWRPKVAPPETSWDVEDSRQQWKEQKPIEEPPSGHWKATWNEEVEDWKSIDTWEPRETSDWGEDDRHGHHWEEHRKHRGPRTPPGEPSGPHTPPDIDAPDNYSMSHPSLDVEKTEVSTESSVDVQDLEGEDQGELFEPLTPEQSPINRKNLSTSDIPDVTQGFDEEEPPEVIEHAYEEIVSDEEVLDEQELENLMEDDDFDPEQIADDEGWNTIGIYDPFEVLALIKPLENFAAPYNTPFQTLKAKLQTTPSDDNVPDEVTKLNDLIRGQSEDDYGSKWVSTLEELQPLVIPWLAYLDEQQVDIIMDWSIKALDLSVALSQTLAVNTRQLKVGMKIVAAVAVADIQLTEKFIDKNAVKRLLELLFADHMASSLKLMALKALDSLTNWQTGLEFLLTSSSTKDDGPPSPKRRRRDEPESSGYQMLLGLLLSKQAVRVMKATTALVQKVHAYEVLSRLRLVTQSIIDSSPPTDLETITEEKSTTKDDSSEASRETPPPQRMETEGIAPAEPSFQPASSSLVEDIESAADCIEQIVETIRTASFKLVQPSIKSFPTTVKLTDEVSTADPGPMLFHLFQNCKLLESVQMLLVSPPTSTHDGIFDGIRDLMQSLMASHSGLQFFSLNCNTSKAIIQALTNTYDDDTQESNESCNLGLQLLQSLQVMQYVDKLKGLIDGCESVGGNEREEAAEILGTAYTMMFSPTGKSCLASVFGLDTHLDYLLPFLEFPGDELEVNHKIQISVSYGYASHLLQCVLQYLDDVTILKNYSTRIINCSAEENGFTKWLEPVKGISYDLNSIKTLVEYVQKNSASLSADLPGSGPGLVTSLRVLKYFACPPVDMKNGEQQKDLRYKLATIQLFSADAMNIFIDLLKVIGDLFLRPWQVSQGGNCLGAYILEAMVSPLLKLIHRMVTDLLSSSSIEFRNERLVTNLLTLSSALHCSTATSGVVSNDIQLMLSNIQDILLTFTSCVADQPIREEAMISSSWGLMLKELLNYIPLSPLSFIGGLTVFSEMLPLPLPIQTQENLTKDEANEALIQRKLWSCYLHCFSEDIQKIIKDVSNSSCLPLQQSLRRVCMQLGDLAAPTALLVVQAVLTALHDSVSDCDEDGKERPCGSNTVHILNLLSYLVAQPSIKVAFLHMLKTSTSGSKSKEPYFAILPRMLTLLNVVHDSTSHLQAQECIMAIEQVLCGPEVSLQLNDTIPLSDQLANSLPCKEHMEAMCTAMLDHVSSPDQSYASILLALRHLSMLLDHDYGFCHVKSAIERNPTALHCLFMRIQSSFNRESSDCLSTLSTSVDFIQLLLTSDTPATDSEVKVEPGTYRTYTMSVEKIREWLRWDANDHPLLTLEKTLEDCCKEDLTLESLLETIATLSQTLTETEDLLKCNDLGEITLPPQMSLTEQMNLRVVYVVGDVDDDRWSPSYWIGVPGMDEGEIEPELVPCDLEELRAACIPTFDLKAELDRGSTDTIKLKKKSTRSRRRVPLVTGGMNKSGGAIKRSHGMTRGNSYGRRPYDTFRQRPQNTSRPPSMHVDDFIAMEQEPDHKRPNKGPPTGRNGRGFMGGSRGGFQGSRPWNGPSGSSYSGRREMGDRNSSQRPSSGRGQWERRGSSGPGRGFPHRRPDSRQDSRPLPRAGGRGRDNPYIRGGPRGSMRGLGPSRGGPSQRRPNTRGRGGFRPAHWSTQGSKADHGRFPPPRSRAGYNRQGGRDRHQRSFTR
ncbi:protein virilizer homolog isoform X2 [Antedon mediterranea]|uniref:protein virilizer homolog isoform X2 n=1 Tax=Antedon mediterranea TaxID=105859 RepID=UPI003AF87C7D